MKRYAGGSFAGAKPIFISYSSRHREATRALAAVLEMEYGPGSVWWDHDLETRGPYADQIRAALESARVVVVIWTAGATVSDWVYAEATSAYGQGKLVNVRPADLRYLDIPQPFNIHHIADLEDRERILSTIAKVMTGTPIPTRVSLAELYFRQHGRRLIDPKQSELPRDPREVSPTQLLQAKFGVVGYLDVTGIKGRLLAWCLEPSRPTAGRLVHGPGGLGKTRLMIEVAAVLRERGWTAGFLERPHEQVDATMRQRWQALEQLMAGGDDAGLLIVIDYSEDRRDEVKRLAELVRRPRETETRPIRLVLLARSAGDWWTSLYDETPEVQTLFADMSSYPGVIEPEPVVELPAVDTPALRLALFRQSLAEFTPRLAAQGYRLSQGEPPAPRLARIESRDGYARPLAIQIEALLWLASSDPEGGPVDVDSLLRRVLGLERAHWAKLVGSLDDEQTRDLTRAVAQVTLVQGTSERASTESLLMADDFYRGKRIGRADVDPVVRSLSRLYGTSNGAGGVDQLEPDLIGEHHVALVGDKELLDGCLQWIERGPAEARSDRRRAVVTALQRATQPEHGNEAIARAAALVDNVIDQHTTVVATEMVAAMIDTPGVMIERFEQKVDALDEEALEAVSRVLPARSLSLMEVALGVARRRVRLAEERVPRLRFGVARLVVAALLRVRADRKTESSFAAVAERLATQSMRLTALGRTEEALIASQEGADIYERLAQTRPDAFLPHLASSLNNLGTCFSNLGRREDALAATQRAVAIYRPLAQAAPRVFLPDLASSLNNLGTRFSSLGRREDALDATQQAVDIYRPFADTDAFLPDLASSLNNLGMLLSNVGRREDALAAAQQAADIYRALAATRPDAFLPDLAWASHNLGVALSNVGRLEAALTASQEAVDLYHRLVQTRPVAFLPSLASSLNNLGIRLSELGVREEALAATQHAVHIHRRLAQTQPDAFLPDLASSLNNLGNCLSEIGRPEEALVATGQAVDIRAQLAQTRPEAFLPDLASSLNNLGACLSDLGRHEEALAATRQAVDIRRTLAQSSPEAFLPDVAMSLSNLGSRLSDLERPQEAFAAVEEAIAIRRRLAQIRPDAFSPSLAKSLGLASAILASLERHREAAEVAEEALEMLAPFLEGHPRVFGESAAIIAADAFRYYTTAGMPPNMELLDRIARALNQ